jgi:GNAT superfamily N-acetyltransferase
VNATASGSRIDRLKPEEMSNGFRTFEINAETGENLGRLNMLYLKRTIPCYYLVYVEVMPAFRGLGLGTRIVTAFKEFLVAKKAVGLLDNIVPPDDPTYTIYTNLGWRPLAEAIGNGGNEDWSNYMVLVPDTIQSQDIKNDLTRVLFSLKKSRPIIEMHDNEDMVKRTIMEFQNVYESLLKIFHEDLQSGAPNTLMNFMFTRLTTRLLGFHRRIVSLIGYTGGESLEQISFTDEIKRLPLQPYSLWRFDKEDGGMWGNEEILRSLPRELKEDPSIYIENLPFYRRPYLDNWIKRTGRYPSQNLSITDLLDFRFDPTRLREFRHNGVKYIFERVSPLFFNDLLRKRAFLRKVEKSEADFHCRGTIIRVKSIVLVVRDRGNVYALRRQVEGVHSQEALDQLKTVPHLKTLNDAIGIDRCIQAVMKDTRDSLRKKFHARFKREIEELAYFIPWDIERNSPEIRVDISKISLDTVWLA